MKIHSFFIKFHGNYSEGQIRLSSESDQEIFHQITRVLKLRVYEKIYILNNEGNRFLCKIESITKKDIILSIEENIFQEKAINNILYIPYLKLSKIEILFDMCTQIGINNFKFLKSDFSAKENEFLSNNKKIRLQRIVTEASEQSEKYYIPEIDFNIYPLEDINLDIKTFVCVERNLSDSSFKASKKLDMSKKQLLIGPEGGWSEKEKDYFNKHEEITQINLGKEILRAETAAIIGSFQINNEKL